MSSLPTHHPIRILRRNRRPLAALLAGGAMLVAIQAVRPPGPPTSAVVVARHQIPAGTQLAAGDLVVAQVGSQLVPEGAVRDPEALIGSVTAVTVAAHEPLTQARLLGRELGADPDRPDNRPMPVRIADPDAASLLGPGNRVDLIAATANSLDAEGTGSSGASARTVASDVLVLSRVKSAGGDSSSASGSLVLVSVTPQEAIELAAAQAGGRITFTVTD
jgi:Flp pilus assembly protein CpaB